MARSGSAMLLQQAYGGDELYGPGYRVFACTRGQRRVLLRSYGEGTSVRILHVRFTSRYVGFAVTTLSSACTKYFGGDPMCRSATVASFARRSGRERASTAAVAEALALTPAGWLAWVTPGDPTGIRQVLGLDSAGARTLGSGQVDPGSLSAAGETVSWRNGGVAESATLR